VAALVLLNPQVKHVILQCTAINTIDASALESLETIVQRLRDAGVQLHLSEVKGPVMDRLQRSDFLQHLSGQVFLSGAPHGPQHQRNQSASRHSGCTGSPAALRLGQHTAAG
jgi:MFS superfamily sulfate permease-like transporter